MSWSISTSGESEAIGKAFDAERDRMLTFKMPEGEARDIDEARDFAMQLASVHGPLNVSASGHWVNFGADGPTFGRISVTIEKTTSS